VTNAAAVTLDEVDLWDLAHFARGTEHAMFDCLRDEAPVWWHDRPGGEPFWAVTGYTEARTILCDPATSARLPSAAACSSGGAKPALQCSPRGSGVR
jgi:hypothetical protein